MKKAFTLVELLAVIVLLGVISFITIPNVSKLLIDSRHDLYEKQLEVIKVGAKLWTLDEENRLILSSNELWPYVITLKDLIDSNYVDESIINPLNEEQISLSTLIHINFQNNNYTFSIDDSTINTNSIITLNGGSNIDIEVNTTYTELGVLDKEGIDITNIVNKRIYSNSELVDNINTDTLGYYTIYYTFGIGNDTETLVRRVNVVDTTAPTITCSGCSSVINLESTNSYVLPTVTATDNYDDDVLITKVGSFSSVIPGNKKITYIATDSSGNSSTLEIVFVVKDTISPIIASIDKVEDNNGITIYTINAMDSGSGIKEYSSDGGLTWQKSNVFELLFNDEVRNFIVKDYAGNISTSQDKDNLLIDYVYKGSSEKFVVPKNGYYKIELWGAQGGNANTIKGGYGGYSSGIIYLNKDEELYLTVGGQGENGKAESYYITDGGYNGGGKGYVSSTAYYVSGGGGATHIAKKEGLLSTLENEKDSVLMVASGGGGVTYNTENYKTLTIGHGGGLIGFTATGRATSGMGTATGGTQTSGNAFGQGADGNSASRAGGGGGYYGGKTSAYSAGGGSSFILGYAGINPISLSSSNKYFIDGEMEPGVNSGNGKAKIAYIEENKPERINSKLNNVKYIKDCINGNSINSGNHWVELQAISDGINVALNKYVMSSALADNSYPLNRIVDGDITSANFSEINETGLQCITVYLDDTYNLDEIAVWHYWSDDRSYNNNITYVSNDNYTWIEVIHNNETETANGKRVSAYD